MLKIYTLSSTRNPNDIRYVGKTNQSLDRRLAQHLSCSKIYKKNKKFSIYNYNWINKEIQDGYSILIESIDELDLSINPDWKWLEQYWISQFKSWGFKLTNLTSGGDGNQNQIFTKESLLKRSRSLKDRHRPEEVKIKISNKLKGRKLSDSHKQKVKESIIKLQGKSINQYTLDGIFIKTWKCVKEAGTYYNTDCGNIIKCCNRDKNHSTCVNYIWRYCDDSLPILHGTFKKFVKQYDLNGNLIKTWNSVMQVAKELNISYAQVYNCCKNKKEKYKNYIWKYEY